MRSYFSCFVVAAQFLKQGVFRNIWMVQTYRVQFYSFNSLQIFTDLHPSECLVLGTQPGLRPRGKRLQERSRLSGRAASKRGGQ